MSADELIEVVREYHVLYDPKSKDYKDHLKRTAAWEEIGQRLKLPAEQCKEHWGKLRNALLSAIKRRKTKSGQAAKNITAWKYEDQMMFLRPHIKMRTTKPPLSQTSENSPPDYDSESRDTSTPNVRSSDESQRSLSLKRAVSGTRKPDIGDIYELMQNNNDMRRERHQFKRDMDETDLFFLSMSKAVKSLPKLEQTKKIRFTYGDFAGRNSSDF
ncbi:hypothetical protein MSG28_005361 [Choristoneura fumiferana]|uniref:Uncharacterized protein n=1 Tax=Choristoneura fumiferana TaxID=7141 RepID=A0ACC0JQY6_CHOFU|nr:hypothetical protein MSG28_005361 [Choristoneura fumiferana]